MHEDSDCRKEEEKKEKASFKLLFMGWNLPWEMNKERTKLQTEEVFTAHVSIKTKETRADALILSRLYSRHGGWARDEKWAGGEMVGEVEGMSAGAKRESGGMALRGTVGLRGNIWLGQEFTWVTRWRERGTTAWCYKKEMRWRRYVRKRSQRGLTEYQRYTFKFGF